MELIGREWEQEHVDGLLDMISEGPAALVLEGDAGIGKTTLWRAAVDTARRRSYRLLVCRASQSESALSFLGLGDLLDGLSSEALEDLPEPQRAALELALLRSAGQGPPDRVSLARATLGVLRASAAQAPTVLAIDDVQWLDPPSADALRFVAHRLTDERLGLVVSGRKDGSASLELDQAFPGTRLVRLRLEPLSFEELEEVVRLHVPVDFTRPTWSMLYRTAAGNPFFAIQLAEALERGVRPPGEELPVPETLAEAVRARLTALSSGARAALLPIAALAQPSLTLVRSGVADAGGVQEALAAGVLQLDGERLRFAHPLLGSYVYGDVSEDERREVHARLASLVTDPEEQALHLGRGIVDADESVAATLESAADRAAKRGHPEIAGELAEQAARLTPAERSKDRARRIRAAAEVLIAAGDARRSLDLLEELVDELPPSEERARALGLLGSYLDDVPRCSALLEQALGEAGDDLALRSHILSLLCWKDGFRGDWRRASRHAREAVALGERSRDRAALASGLGRLAWAEVGPDSAATIDRAAELEATLTDPLPFPVSPGFIHGVVLLTLDRIDDARQRFEESFERAVAQGNIWRSINLAWLAELELRAGNWDRALAHAQKSKELGQWGIVSGEIWAAASIALVEAHLGNEEAALQIATRASGLARANGFRLALERSENVLGFLRLSAGDAKTALDHLLPLLEEGAEVELHPSLVSRTLSNAIEALVGTGELAGADSLTGRLEEHARALPVPSTIAAAGRCRALVLAQGGDLVGARASIEAALSAHSRLREPFELARTYLSQGSIERRAKHKAEARVALGHAEAIFAELGARLWVERVERELARTGLTRSLDRELTPTELRIAQLAAGGSQNKEIAGALFVSVKTVEANLSRVYAKLGIRSRGELASQLSTRNDDGAGAPSVAQPSSIDVRTAR